MKQLSEIDLIKRKNVNEKVVPKEQMDRPAYVNWNLVSRNIKII